MRRVVAFIASQARMLSFQEITGLFVIECLRVPLDQREIFAIVLGVAAGAFLAGSGRNVVGGVQPPARGDAGANLRVATHAFQCSLSAKLMATGTVCGSIQRLVRTRQRSG